MLLVCTSPYLGLLALIGVAVVLVILGVAVVLVILVVALGITYKCHKLRAGKSRLLVAGERQSTESTSDINSQCPSVELLCLVAFYQIQLK